MNTASDYEEMSDEDFANATPQSSSESTDQSVESPAPAEEVDQDVDHTTPDHTEANAEGDQQNEAEEEEDEVSDEDLGDSPEAAPTEENSEDESDAVDSKETPTSDDESQTKASTEDKTETAAEPTDYKAEYDKIMAPFKANGREFKVENPGEAVQLMQLGANYTQKMQALKPNLKMMRMLENNDLLDESKLAFLIDINKKDPTAIQKLLHDSSIDPMDLDTSAEPTYKASNHSVGDEEMLFHNVLSDVNASPGGKETVSHINSNWDAVSKDAVYKEPAILAAINEQRGNGIYDLITTELNRQQTLGTLSPDIPFIQAYRKVGDELNNQGRLTLGAPTVPSKVPVPETVLETRIAPRKQTVSNGEKARAASATKSSSKVPAKTFDPFSMSDEEIMAIPSPRG